MFQALPHPARLCQVPLECAPGGGMRKIRQCGVQFAQQSPDAPEKFRRVRLCLRHRCPRYKRKQPHQPFAIIIQRRCANWVALKSWVDLWKRKLRRALCQVFESLAWQVHQFHRVARTHHLEEILFAIVCPQVKVVVRLADEFPQLAAQAVKLLCRSCSRLHRQRFLDLCVPRHALVGEDSRKTRQVFPPLHSPRLYHSQYFPVSKEVAVIDPRLSRTNVMGSGAYRRQLHCGFVGRGFNPDKNAAWQKGTTRQQGSLAGRGFSPDKKKAKKKGF